MGERRVVRVGADAELELYRWMLEEYRVSLFAQQLVYHFAGPDRPILYLTTLSEPLT